MITRLTCLSMLLLAGINPAAASSPGNVPGRYHLRVCRGPCTSKSLLAEGALTLLPAPLRDASGQLLLANGVDPANGCFVLATVHRRGRTMLGGPRTGVTAWSTDRRTGEVRFDLVPDGIDAFYPVVLHAVPGGMTGEGRSVYANDPGWSAPVDLVVADRRGDAEPSMCAPSTPASRIPPSLAAPARSVSQD